MGGSKGSEPLGHITAAAVEVTAEQLQLTDSVCAAAIAKSSSLFCLLHSPSFLFSPSSVVVVVVVIVRC